jgi:bacillolysin
MANTSPRRGKIVLGVVLALLGVGYFIATRRPSERATTTTGAHATAATQATPQGMMPAAGVVKKPLGTTTVRPPTVAERELAEHAMAAVKNLQPTAAPSPDMLPARPGPANLAAKAPKLSEAQQRVLQKLRWGMGKDLSYRGDGEDATVRMLSSASLAAPADATNPTAEPPGEKVRGFIADNRDLFLLQDPAKELNVTAVEPDPNGGSVVRLAQRFGGLEVWPGTLTANVSAAGHLTTVTGTYVPTPDKIDLSASRVQPAEALAAAREHVKITAADQLPGSPPPTLKIFADKGRIPELAYDVRLSTAGKAERVFVSALNGAVLLAVSEICPAAVTATVPDMFGQSRTINVFSTGTPVRYVMVDTTKAMYNASNGTGIVGIYDGSVSSYPFATSSSLTSGFDPIAVSASYNLGKAYDFYASVFSRNSFDGKGSSVNGLVRVPDPETRGVMSNAFWNGQSQTMNFGTGDYYAGATDVIGHEYTHAVVEYSAKLIYNADSGALNESFADIFGEALERYTTGSNDWLMGTQLKTVIRSMKDPASKGQPATMSQYKRTASDNGGVHTNSGIPNYAFYQLAEGLPGGGIGFDPARNIFYRALTTKLNSRSDFEDLRAACVASATELFGAGSAQVTKTGQAFDLAEIFDASQVPAPSNLTPPNGPDSYLAAYRAVNTNTYLGRREAALGDGNSITPISTTAMNPNTRASVVGNGSLAGFVTANYDVVFATTSGSSSSAAGLPGRYNAIAMSADAKFFACVARNPSTGLPINLIAYGNLTTGAIDVIDLYLPVADGPSTISITTVDEVDLSPDGQLALFDGFARTTLGDGTVVQGWSIFCVDLRTKAIFSLVGPLQGVNLGNPAFGRTSDQRVIFEADATDGTSTAVFAVDLVAGKIATVKQFTPASRFFCYPRYSAADDFVVYTDQYVTTSSTIDAVVGRIALASDKITPSGSATAVQYGAYSGLSYRRGTFAGAPTLAVSAVTSSIGGNQTGTFRITRTSGDQAIQVPVSFKTLGTAKAGVDYTSISTTATIPAGGTSVDITVKATASPTGPSRTLTLSLDPQNHYVVSSAGADASMTIVGAAAKPVISTQPLAQTAGAGSTVALSVTVSDPTGATYQWYKNGAAISGATSSSLTLRNITAADAGSYTCVVTNASDSTTSSAATLTLGVAATLSNLSVRTSMSAGQTLIVGAVVSGGAKTILIRAAGPALTAFGLPGMVDPRLELYTTGNAPTAVNDDWPASLAPTFTAVGAFGFAAGSKDAAMSQSLNGSFSVQCKGTGAGTVLVEAYDVTGGSSPRLINVSARNRVGTDSDILIAGFAISGTGTKQLLIRGVGPQLGQFGVAGTLADPTIKVYDSASRLVAENDNWNSSLAATFSSVGAFGLTAGSKDAALVANLNAGATYTVQVSGVNGSTGEALVEIYELP